MVMMWPDFAFGFRVFLEFLGFLDVLGILVRQVSLLRESPDNSRIPGLYLSRQVSLHRHPTEHPLAILENSTLGGDWNSFFFVRQVSLNTKSVDLRRWIPPGFSTQSDCPQMKNLSRQWRPSSSPLALIVQQSCYLVSVLASSSPSFWCSWSSWNS